MSIELSPVALIHNNAEQPLTLYRGYDDNIIAQLVEKSKEPEIVRRCPKDAAKRFSSEEAFYTWVTKGVGGRVLYPLLDDATKDLGGVIWLGVEKFTGDAYRQKTNGSTSDDLVPGIDPNLLTHAAAMTDTFALRTYESQRGQGVSRRATIQAIADYAIQRTASPITMPQLTGIHLETDIDNLPSRKVYQKLLHGVGFVPVAESLDNNRIAMILPGASLPTVIDAAKTQARRELL